LIGVWLALVGCTCSPTEREAEYAALELAENQKVDPVQQEQPAAVDEGPALEIELEWSNISPLHQTFFSDPGTVDKLRQGLRGHVASPAKVHVRWSSENFKGEVCHRLQSAVPSQSPPDLQILSPYAMALTAFRNHVGQNYDLRVLSFDICIEAGDCRFSILETAEMNGRALSPCVAFKGEMECGQPTKNGVEFSSSLARRISVCLGAP
jgi:hypothetical protein